MKKLHRSLLAGSVIASSLVFSAQFAFAATGTAVQNGLMLAKGAKSITLTVPNMDSELQPTPTLPFTFTPSNPTVKPMTTTGTYVPGSPDEYTVPVPNFGKTEVVDVSTGYTFNGVNYTATAGPLIDTLPEVPLAAALPLGMLGVWYIVRKRRRASLSL